MTGLVLTQSLGGAVLFTVAWLLVRATRRRSAATRALVWSSVVVAVLLLPAVALLVPEVEIPVLPGDALPAASVSRGDADSPASRVAEVPGIVASDLADSGSAGQLSSAETASAPGATVVSAPRPEAALSGGSEGLRGERERRRSGSALFASLVRLAPWVWAIGVGVLLVRLLVGVLRVRGIERRAVAVRCPGMKQAFARAREALRLRAHVELLETDELPIPATWHLRRPCVLVPTSMSGWSAERQEAVLLHELAHVRRNDGRIQLLAQAVAALHWFDPLSWVALAGLRREREQACDDAVLDAGVRPTAYATHLLEIARASRRRAPTFLPAMSLLHDTALSGRVRGILDPMTGRRSPDRRTSVSVVGLIFLLTLPVAMLRPVAAQPQAPEPPPAAPAATAPAPMPAVEASAAGSTPAPFAEPAPAGTPMAPFTAPAPAAAAPAPFTTAAAPGAAASQAPTAEPRPALDDLVRMRIHGITPEYVEAMTAFLGRDLEIDTLVTLKIHGASAELGREMSDLLGALDAGDLVQARIHGTTPEYAREMKALLGDGLTLSDLVQMRIHGLSAADARRLQELLSPTDLEVGDLVKMRIHGVTPELVEELREVGYTDLRVEELVKIRIHGMERVMLRRRDGGR